ncbi:6755_t:CDS:2, partial [Cetraspora pellucida]
MYKGPVNEELESKELVSKELVSKELASKELASEELVSKELASKELSSKELASKELASEELMGKELASEKLVTKKLVSKELAEGGLMNEELIYKPLDTTHFDNDDEWEKLTDFHENIFNDNYDSGYEHNPQIVAVKSFHDSSDDLKFLDELIYLVKCHVNFHITHQFLHTYGLTQHPSTKEYMMVTEYANLGDLRSYLASNFSTLMWFQKLEILKGLLSCLKSIHKEGFIHLYEQIEFWYWVLFTNDESIFSNDEEIEAINQIRNPFMTADKIIPTLQTKFEIHPDAIYKSKFTNTKQLSSLLSLDTEYLTDSHYEIFDVSE